jgi:hypothetical protein
MVASACGVDTRKEQEGASSRIQHSESADARAVIETIRSRFRLAHTNVPVLRDAEVVGFHHHDGWIQPRFARGASVVRSARVALPESASQPFRIQDEA